MSKPGWAPESGVRRTERLRAVRTPRPGMLGNGLLLRQHEQLFPLISVAEAASARPAHSPADLPVLPSHTACLQTPQTLSNCLSEAAGTLLRRRGRGSLPEAAGEERRRSWAAAEVLDSGLSVTWWPIFMSDTLGPNIEHENHFFGNQKVFEMISD